MLNHTKWAPAVVIGPILAEVLVPHIYARVRRPHFRHRALAGLNPCRGLGSILDRMCQAVGAMLLNGLAVEGTLRILRRETGLTVWYKTVLTVVRCEGTVLHGTSVIKKGHRE